jgi:DNA-directed RNA polymerase subunit RPC12/RpoP
MSEIKFACPHCSQHIACDEDYANAQIKCPGCGKPMTVPRLTPHQAGSFPLVVASSPPPPRPWKNRPPQVWTEVEWEQQVEKTCGRNHLSPLAMALIFLPVILVLVLAPWVPRDLARFYPTFWIIIGFLCSSLAAWLIVSAMSSDGGWRALIAIPLAAGILLMQLAFMSASGCCVGAAGN